MTNADGFSGRIRRNRRTAIGVAGVAAVLGGGAFLITDHLTEKSDMGAQKPVSEGAADSVSLAPALSASPETANTTAQKKEAQFGPVAPATSANLEQRVDAARSANERLGTEVRRPLPAPTITVDENKVKVVQTGSVKERHTLKVASSAQDLTGFRELAWARNGKPVGGALCTNSITTSSTVPAKERKTLLICWKVSEKRSAYTVAVDFDKPPSEAESLAALDKAWNEIR